MQVYRVGGYVRDQLLGREPHDCDYVVVGATVNQMLSLGYQAVGKSFPVFLHPQTHEEYALARSERKQGVGHTGFAIISDPTITLEQDLARRDLTINAMALDQNGQLIDPFGGRADLAAGCLRHVSAAFADDPLRILRVARFAARFNFQVHPTTMRLMQQMAASNDGYHLSRERIVAELARALAEPYTDNFIQVLAESQNLAIFFPLLAAALAYSPSFSKLQPNLLSHQLRQLQTPVAKLAALAITINQTFERPNYTELTLHKAERKILDNITTLNQLFIQPQPDIAASWLNSYRKLELWRNQQFFQHCCKLYTEWLQLQPELAEQLSRFQRFQEIANQISSLDLHPLLATVASNHERGQLINNYYYQQIAARLKPQAKGETT